MEISSSNPPEEDQGKNLLRFIIPSLLGAFFFLLPIKYNDNWTIPMGVLSKSLQTQLQDIMPMVVLAIVLFSAFFTLGVKFYKKSKPEIALNNFCKGFDISPTWLVIRLLGALFAVAIFFQLGPEWIWHKSTGHVVFYDLAIPIVTIFIFAAFLLPLLTDYGLMEFVGTALRTTFHKLFGLPGRACIDAMASWMAASAVGCTDHLPTIRQGLLQRS